MPGCHVPPALPWAHRWVPRESTPAGASSGHRRGALGAALGAYLCGEDGDHQCGAAGGGAGVGGASGKVDSGKGSGAEGALPEGAVMGGSVGEGVLGEGGVVVGVL